MTSHVIDDADFHLDLVKGTISNYTVLQKFGRNKAVGTSYAPISIGGVYQTPQVSGATQLRVKAGNTNDTANGSGARTIFLQGIDATGALISETISTNGTSNGTASTNSFLRLLRAYVATSGTYGTSAAGSHAADIIIENAAGGTTWATINSENFPKGQTEIGVYIVPLGYRAFIQNIFAYVESTKPATILLFQRENILQTSAPYSAIRLVFDAVGVDGAISLAREIPLGPFPALTDIGFMARVASTTAAVSINFDIILETV